MKTRFGSVATIALGVVACTLRGQGSEIQGLPRLCGRPAANDQP